MPSPVGHALAGLLVALAVAPRPPAGAPDRGVGSRGLSPIAAASLLGIMAGLAPDLDLVPGLLLGEPGRFHHGASHSVGAAALSAFGGGALALGRAGDLTGLAGVGAVRAGLVAALAVLAHALLDALAVDTSTPYGVALWWPLADGYVIAPWTPFLDVRREQHSTAAFFATLASWHNLRAVLLEILLLGPPCLLVLHVGRARRPGRPT